MTKEEVLRRGYAKTREEWWLLVDHHWSNLSRLIGRFTPKQKEEAQKAKESRDAVALFRHLDQAWWEAPDSPAILGIPGWGMLCDLCSDFPPAEEGD